MTLVKTVLWIHVAAGFLALVLGPIAMSVRKRRGTHTRVGEIYHWLVLTVCLLAVVVVMFDFARLWLFLPIAGGSYAFALLGYLAAKFRWRDWLNWHVIGQGGSYIAMVTAFLVANGNAIAKFTGVQIPPPIAWALPSIIGTLLIVWVNQKINAKRGSRERT